MVSKKNLLIFIIYLLTIPISIQVYTFIQGKKTLPKTVFFQSLKAVDEIYREMNKILIEGNAMRVLLLRVEDSGEVPIPGKTMYSSIVYEVFGANQVSIKSTWQRRRIDGPYVKLLTNVVTYGKHVNVTNQMPRSELRDVYQSKGIAQSYVYSIYQEPAYFFYLSVTFGQERELNASEKVGLKSGVNNLINIFEKYRNNLDAFKSLNFKNKKSTAQ